MGRIDAVIADDGNACLGRKVNNIAVQIDGKRMGGIYQETDIMLLAKSGHLGHFHRADHVAAMNELDVLRIASGGIEKFGPRFLEHLGRDAALSRSTKNEYHSL